MPALSQTRNTTIRPYLLKTLPNKVLPNKAKRSRGWLNRFHGLARHYERSREALVGLRFVVFSVLIVIYFAAFNKGA